MPLQWRQTSACLGQLVSAQKRGAGLAPPADVEQRALKGGGIGRMEDGWATFRARVSRSASTGKRRF